MVSMQSTHPVLYSPKTIDDGQTQPLVSMPEDDDASVSSAPPSRPGPLPLDPEPPELLFVSGSPLEPSPLEPPHAAAAARTTVTTARAKPRPTRTRPSIDSSHMRVCRQGRQESNRARG